MESKSALIRLYNELNPDLNARLLPALDQEVKDIIMSPHRPSPELISGMRADTIGEIKRKKDEARKLEARMKAVQAEMIAYWNAVEELLPEFRRVAA